MWQIFMRNLSIFKNSGTVCNVFQHQCGPVVTPAVFTSTNPLTTSSATLDTGLPNVVVRQKLKEWEENINPDILLDDAKIIHEMHLKAVKSSEEIYCDPVTGFHVYTILAHLKRGYCCGDACRHCAYEHINVPVKFKRLKIYNTAFYV